MDDTKLEEWLILWRQGCFSKGPRWVEERAHGDLGQFSKGQFKVLSPGWSGWDRRLESNVVVWGLGDQVAPGLR